MAEKSSASSEYESMMRRVRERAEALRSSPGYDPRKEREIDDLYNQYIPPYATQGNDSLIDIAERDAYINGIPPLGSQKKGGIVIKKTIRSAIGWYMQFVTQQISTFGSGVARALRAMNNDIEELKKNIASTSDNEFLYTLQMVPKSQELDTVLSKSFHDGPVLISDSLSSSTIDALRDNVQVIVVDPNPSTIENLASSVDVRQESLNTFTSALMDARISGAVLSGRIECVDPRIRYTTIENLSSVCIPGSRVGVVISTQPSEDQLLACEILGTSLWSESAWKKVLEFFLGDVTSDVVDNGYVFISGTIRHGS